MLGGTHFEHRECEQARREHVKRSEVAQAEFFGDDRAGYRRADVAPPANFSGIGPRTNPNAHALAISPAGQDRSRPPAAPQDEFLAREGANGIANHPLFFAKFKTDHELERILAELKVIGRTYSMQFRWILHQRRSPLSREKRNAQSRYSQVLQVHEHPRDHA